MTRFFIILLFFCLPAFIHPSPVSPSSSVLRPEFKIRLRCNSWKLMSFKFFFRCWIFLFYFFYIFVLFVNYFRFYCCWMNFYGVCMLIFCHLFELYESCWSILFYLLLLQLLCCCYSWRCSFLFYCCCCCKFEVCCIFE